MDGDFGYYLMSRHVYPELMTTHRHRVPPPHRNQAKAPKLPTWTATTATDTTTAAGTAAGTATDTDTITAADTADTATDTAAALTPAASSTSSRNTASSTPVSPPINASDNNLTGTISTDTDIDSNHADTANNVDNTTTATTIASNVDGLNPTPDPTAPTPANLGCVCETLDHHADLVGHDGHCHECGNPISAEQTKAGGRRSFSDYRPRLFGRSASRRTTSLTKSSTSGPSHIRTPSSECSSHPGLLPGPSHAQQALPVTFPTVATTTTTVPSPALASPPISPSSNSLKRLQSNRHTDGTVARPNYTPLNRRYKLDPFHRRSTHQFLPPSSSVEPLTTPTKGSSIHGYHSSMPSFPTLSQAPYPTQYSIPSDMPSPRSSGFASQSGVMTSNENLLSSSAERSGALSTASNATSTTSKAQTTTQLLGSKAFVVRNGRTYINESTLPYPLPVDLPELHRQSLRTLLMFQLFGGPILSSAFASKPPTRVLDVGCGAGFWSMMCHRYFAQHGHSSISFTGLDIVPLGGSGADATAKPDKEMRWRFVQHDIRQIPFPFADGEFDLIMVKDMAFATTFRDSQLIMEEYLRVLKPGGVLEHWETDSTIRMLRPHAPKNMGRYHDDDSSSDGGDDEDNAERMGAYVMTTNTPISAPLNAYLVEYNGWSSKALEARGLSAVPCTLIGAYLLQEAESLTDVQSKRLAVPLSEIRWEREGVGGVVTKDGKSYIDSQKGKIKDQDWKTDSPVTPAQSALRRTALETTVSYILALEPLLREVSGKSQEEWDTWAGKMTNDLLREGGTSWGECLEVGVWTSRKRYSKS
ncbi:hypothetical protein ANO14919_068280 [Xylariales sp. No.14919]|nr:hypothetical protein ANO14919_068280 [Xylariales sp. No.14919]